MTCKRKTISCTRSLMLVSQTISIKKLILLCFLHCKKCVIACKSSLDNLSLVSDILEINYVKLIHNFFSCVLLPLYLSKVKYDSYFRETWIGKSAQIQLIFIHIFKSLYSLLLHFLLP